MILQEATFYTVLPMDEARAREYLSWEYAAPYDFYTIPEGEREGELRNIFSHAESDYYAVLDKDSVMIGIFEYMFPGDMMEIGLGLRPDACGKGLGKDFVRRCVAFGAARYGHNGQVVLLVGEFNRRAIRLYEKVGFRIATTVSRSSYGSDVTFVFMTMDSPDSIT